MRDSFIAKLFEEASADRNVILVVGDLGFGVVDEFAKRLPSQFINAGIAEQSMIGIASGLASAGYTVIVYSIGNFPTLRCLEQVRNDVCYPNRNVTVVSVGAGVAYGGHGYTHHAVEDIAVMRALPGIKVISPADPAEAIVAAHLAASEPGPKYVRLGKNGEPQLHQAERGLAIHAAIPLRTGTDALILGCGAILVNCLAAADMLAEEGIECSVYSVPTVKPLDLSLLATVPAGIPVVTVEEHTLAGGFGSAVVEHVSDLRLGMRVQRLGLDARLIASIGSQEYLRELSGLDPAGIASSVRKLVSENSGNR